MTRTWSQASNIRVLIFIISFVLVMAFMFHSKTISSYDFSQVIYSMTPQQEIRIVSNETNKRMRPSKDYNRSIALWHIPVSYDRINNTELPAFDFLPNYKNPCWRDMTSGKIKCLPYFYQLGIAKCGTTALYNQFIKHPEIVKARRKEIFYWDWFWTKSFKRYLQNFENASYIMQSTNDNGFHKRITLDATPVYLTKQGPLTKIPGNVLGSEPRYTLAHTLYSLNPNTRFIISLRDPTIRLYSHYHHFRKVINKPFSPKDFHDHVVTALAWMNHCLDVHSLRSCVFDYKLNMKIRQKQRIMLHFSMYYPYVKELLSVFPSNQILIIKAEEFYTEPAKVMKQAFELLGVDATLPDIYEEIERDMVDIRDKYLSTSKNDGYLEGMWNSTKILLDNFFKPFNRQLADLLGEPKFLFERET